MRRHLESLTDQWRHGQQRRLHLGRPIDLIGAIGHQRLEALQVGPIVDLHATPVESVDHCEVKLSGADRFHEIRVGAVLHCGLAELGIVDARDHHDRCIGMLGLQLLQQSVAGFVRQPHVKQGQAVLLAVDECARGSARERDVGVKASALQRSLHDLGQCLLVVDDQGPKRVVGGRHLPKCSYQATSSRS
jgi:hypothetical protein